MRLLRGPLAQLVEQLTLNQLVVGSNPTRPTNHPLFTPWNDVARPESGVLRGCLPASGIRYNPHFDTGSCKSGWVAGKPGSHSGPSVRTFVFPAFLSRITASKFAVLVELVDTPDLGSGGATCPSSSLGDGTKFPRIAPIPGDCAWVPGPVAVFTIIFSD